jgi:hypothetical protein
LAELSSFVRLIVRLNVVPWSIVDATGEVTISLTASQSTLVKAGRYVYDVEITGTDPVETLRVLEGLVTVTPQVTKAA